MSRVLAVQIVSNVLNLKAVTFPAEAQPDLLEDGNAHIHKGR
jgi:hypothetical protein